MARFTTKADLLSNASATGAAKTIEFGGRFLLVVTGTFGGASVKLQLLGPDGLTYVDVPDAAMFAPGVVEALLPDNATVRAAVSGGAPDALYATLRSCPE